MKELISLFLLEVLVFAATEGFKCDFEKDDCGFVQMKNDDFDWSRRRGRTPSQGTGPSSDHTSMKGYYMYTEASDRRRGDTSRMELVSLDFSGDKCLFFYYHMVGSGVGSLNVYIGGSKVFSKNGPQGLTWRKAQIWAQQKGTATLTFEGVIGKSFLSDIAVDDISVEDCTGTPEPTITSKPPVTETTTTKPETKPPKPPAPSTIPTPPTPPAPPSPPIPTAPPTPPMPETPLPP
ncbi:predicted protein, partial [Nematostella vectensis]